MKNILYTIILSFLFSSSVFAGFQEGLGAIGKSDDVTVLKWKALAEQGDAKAQFNLGVMYVKGDGVTQDYQEAVKWYRLAGEQGDAKAQYNLGVMYGNGEGVTQDYKEALKWYRLAAEQRYATAQSNLGLMYAQGQGVIQDNVIAYMWFKIAISNGSELAKTNRDNAERIMTSEQIAKAQKLARECIAKNYKGCDQKEQEIPEPKIDKLKEQEVPEPKIDKLKEKCQNIGFKPNTDEFKNCVLELML